jgi:hypothetical protein
MGRKLIASALKVSLMEVEPAIMPKEGAEVVMNRIEIGGPNQ